MRWTTAGSISRTTLARVHRSCSTDPERRGYLTEDGAAIAAAAEAMLAQGAGAHFEAERVVPTVLRTLRENS